jgi:hypothetical protein
MMDIDLGTNKTIIPQLYFNFINFVDKFTDTF